MFVKSERVLYLERKERLITAQSITNQIFKGGLFKDLKEKKPSKVEGFMASLLSSSKNTFARVSRIFGKFQILPRSYNYKLFYQLRTLPESICTKSDFE